jgi:hypothetical protein
MAANEGTPHGHHSWDMDWGAQGQAQIWWPTPFGHTGLWTLGYRDSLS